MKKVLLILAGFTAILTFLLYSSTFSKPNIVVAAPTREQCVAADVTGDDHVVDLKDFQLIGFNHTTGPNPLPYNAKYDLNGDNQVDEKDVGIAYACQTPLPSGLTTPIPLPPSDFWGFGPETFVGNLVTAILPYVLAIAGFLTVIFIIISGIQFATSSGNPEAAAAARGRLTFAIIGFVIIVLAFAITQIVDRIFLGGTGVF